MCKPRVKCCNSQQKLIIIHLEEKKLIWEVENLRKKLARNLEWNNIKLCVKNTNDWRFDINNKWDVKWVAFLQIKRRIPSSPPLKSTISRVREMESFCKNKILYFFSLFQINWDDMVVLSCDFPYIKTTQAWKFKGGIGSLGNEGMKLLIGTDEGNSWNFYKRPINLG
jgi:hypothetical protein